tara:strand:+ start:5177 stop:5923 length:747 start_codon:yes stop_codon:yes gene_type:complete
MAFSTRLPDPAYKRHFSGQNEGPSSAGDFGPGFASVKLTSDQKVMTSRTNSQRILAKAVAGQKWNIDIDYHPMTQAEFRPIDTFLQMKQGALTSFDVALPQYNTPTNAGWVTDLATKAFTAQAIQPAGATNVLIGGSGSYAPNSTTAPTNIPLPGEVFTITDSSNSNHKKVYMITYVETNNIFASTATGNNAHLRLGISPPLAKSVSSGATFNFLSPLFKVVMPTAIRSYSLNTDNLYKFSLKLEEYI